MRKHKKLISATAPGGSRKRSRHVGIRTRALLLHCLCPITTLTPPICVNSLSDEWSAVVGNFNYCNSYLPLLKRHRFRCPPRFLVNFRSRTSFPAKVNLLNTFYTRRVTFIMNNHCVRKHNRKMLKKKLMNVDPGYHRKQTFVLFYAPFTYYSHYMLHFSSFEFENFHLLQTPYRMVSTCMPMKRTQEAWP